jgi:UPF0755 protein
VKDQDESITPIIRIAVIILVPLLVGVVTLFVLKTKFLDAKDYYNTEMVLIEVAPATSMKDVCSMLETRGLIKSAWSLCMLAKMKELDSKIKAGEYQISQSMTPQVILNKLVTGDIFKRVVTVREGTSVRDIGKLLEDAGVISKADFDAAVVNRELLQIAGIEAPSFEGYLFPETYYFSRPITAKDIIFTMLEQGENEKHWPKHFTDQTEKLGMTRHEVLTLASIVEKESGNVNEQPTISAVFHNRLKVGMKLQSDPTVIYGVTNFDGNLTRDHLQTPTPYNTYTNYGLPPGPICNPGETAIKAALYPDNVPHLYFVADGRGGHVFSKTLEEHNEAVNRYQRSQKQAPPVP